MFTIWFNFLDNVGFDIESISANNIQKQSIFQSEETVLTNLEPVQSQPTYDGYGNLSSASEPTSIVCLSTSKFNPDIQVINKKSENYYLSKIYIILKLTHHILYI